MPVVSAPAITGDGGFVQLDTESDRFKHVPVRAVVRLLCKLHGAWFTIRVGPYRARTV